MIRARRESLSRRLGRGPIPAVWINHRGPDLDVEVISLSEKRARVRFVHLGEEVRTYVQIGSLMIKREPRDFGARAPLALFVENELLSEPLTIPELAERVLASGRSDLNPDHLSHVLANFSSRSWIYAEGEERIKGPDNRTRVYRRWAITSSRRKEIEG